MKRWLRINSPPISFCVSPCYVEPSVHSNKNWARSPLILFPHDFMNIQKWPRQTAVHRATDLSEPNQTFKSQQLTRAAKRKKIITACILLPCWGSRLQFRASAVVSAQDKSFPICLCPQMLWTGHNMLWLCILKQCYRSSVGQSCCLEVGAQCRKAAVSVAERHQTESDINRFW